MKTLLATFALLTQLTYAAPEIEIWQGVGTHFSDDGAVMGNYTLTVERVKNGHKTHQTVKVDLGDGRVLEEKCSLTLGSKESWSSDCDHGQGGGRCFGEGLCTSYEANSSGRAFATTIVKDSASQIRLLRVELQNGMATQFYREKLTKRQN